MLYKAFNWSCTHGHTHITSVHTERTSQLFSRWRFGRLIGLRIPERETVSITKTIFTYGFISLVSPRSRHAIQFRSVSWRTLIERPAYELTAKSKFRPEPWKLSENTGILRKTRGRWQRNNQRGRGVIAPIAFSAVSPLLFARLRLKISRPWTYSALKYRKKWSVRGLGIWNSSSWEMWKESWAAGNNVEVTTTLALGKKVEKYEKT